MVHFKRIFSKGSSKLIYQFDFNKWISLDLENVSFLVHSKSFGLKLKIMSKLDGPRKATLFFFNLFLDFGISRGHP